MPARPAVFLDRYGTLSLERGYLTRPEQVRLLVPGPIASSIAKRRCIGQADRVLTLFP
jgi:hypothetical protein